jgi:hypothetical protein
MKNEGVVATTQNSFTIMNRAELRKIAGCE